MQQTLSSTFDEYLKILYKRKNAAIACFIVFFGIIGLNTYRQIPIYQAKAKIVISNKSKRPRMLFKDPHSREWVEPDSFYPFSSGIFYEEDKNVYRDEEEGLTLEAVKEHAWHGIPVIGLKIQAGEDTLIFSSDTINDVHLWKELYTEKHAQRISMPQKDFESASVIYGDINDFIERVWSEERYEEAIRAFEDAVVIHDVCTEPTAVHTHYRLLQSSSLRKERTHIDP
jgi:hypothetical protein